MSMKVNDVGLGFGNGGRGGRGEKKCPHIHNRALDTVPKRTIDEKLAKQCGSSERREFT